MTSYVFITGGVVSSLGKGITSACLGAILEARGLTPHVIGGARVAGELDAKRAIRDGSELAARL